MPGHFVPANCCPCECLFKTGFYFTQAWFVKGITKKKINLVLVSTLRTQKQLIQHRNSSEFLLKVTSDIHYTFKSIFEFVTSWVLHSFSFLLSSLQVKNTQREDLILEIKAQYSRLSTNYFMSSDTDLGPMKPH